PEPIGVIANGIRTNDGYALLPAGTLPNRYQPRPAALLDLTAGAAQFCGELTAQLRDTLEITITDQIIEALAIIKYDPAVLTVLNASAGSFFQGVPGTTVDASVPGELRISAKPGGYLTGSGSLIDAVFRVDGDVTTTSLSGTLTLTNDEICDNTRSFDLTLPMEVTRVVENAQANISLSDFRAEQNSIASADLIVTDLPADAEVREFDVVLDWDQDLIELESIVQTNTQSANWRIDRFNESSTTVRLHVTATNGEVLSNGTLAKLEFRAFLSDTNATEIAVTGQLPSERKCPLVLTIDEHRAQFNTDLLCGEGLILEAMARENRFGARITPNPSRGSFSLEMDAPIVGVATILDALGHEVYQWDLKAGRSQEVTLPGELSSGSYILRLPIDGPGQNLPLVLQI
ncbi:MAG TPA: cohesin domain-containing protein, partial [Candidatus Kapabacteria bacterium]|nr:cohesin domain-containing protein [Candidatus Kapabacteria bacterium]